MKQLARTICNISVEEKSNLTMKSEEIAQRAKGKVKWVSEWTTFFLMRVWRADLSSLRVLSLASSTKGREWEGLGLGSEIDNKKEEDEQEWRKEREEANIVSNFTMTLTDYTTVSTFHGLSSPHLILLSLPLTHAFQASTSNSFMFVWLKYVILFTKYSNILFCSLNKFCSFL